MVQLTKIFLITTINNMTLDEMNAKYGKPTMTLTPKTSVDTSDLETAWGAQQSPLRKLINTGKDVVTGIAKGGGQVGTEALGYIQGVGERALQQGGVDTTNLGFPALKEGTPEYQAQQASMEAKTPTEKIAKGIGELATPLPFGKVEGAKDALILGKTPEIVDTVSKIPGQVVSAIGKSTIKSAIPTSAREAQILQSYKANVPFAERIANLVQDTNLPKSAAQTVADKGLMGTESMLGVQAKKATKSLWNDLIHPQLKASPDKVNMPQFFNELEAKIIKDNPELSRQKDLLEGIQALKDDYAGVHEVPLETLQKFKEGWAKFVPEKAYKGKPISGVFNEIKDTASDLARNKIYSSLGDEVKQAYFDYGNLKAVEELGQKAMTGGKLKGGAGTFISAVKDMAITPVATIGGNIIYNVGKGIQMVGKPGARFVRDIFLENQASPQSTQGQ